MKPIIVCGYNNQATQACGCINARINLVEHGGMICLPFIVSEHLSAPVILGNDVLEKAGIGLYVDSTQSRSQSDYNVYSDSSDVQHTECSKDKCTVIHPSSDSCTQPIKCNATDANETHDAAIVYEEPDIENIGPDDNNSLDKVLNPAIKQLLVQYPSVISSKLSSTPCTVTEHHIELIDTARPYKRTYYRIGPDERKFIEQQIADLLKLGVIAPSRSAWGSPIVLVKKKDGTFRMCIDYRKLNAVTIPENYPLPFIEDSIDKMQGKKVFSKLDLKSSYWQLAMALKDQHLTAFMSHVGLFEWRRMPFGLRNATATFQRLMHQVLAGCESFTEIHVDDIFVFSDTMEEHMKHLQIIMDRLNEAHLILNLPKCHFCEDSVQFIGHIFSSTGISPDPEKCLSMTHLSPPHDQTSARSFLGMTNYYRRFIRDYAAIAHPIIELTKKNTDFIWRAEHQEAFEKLIKILSSTPVLVHPIFSKVFKVTTDASDYAVAGMLSQDHDGIDLPVCYYSRTLSGAQLNYATIEKECLAIIECIRHWRHYLSYQPFLIETDHEPLKWLHSLSEPTRRQTRWSILLQEYEYTISHRPGKSNVVADALSRCQTPAKCNAIATNQSSYDYEDHLISFFKTHQHPIGVSLAQQHRIEKKAMELHVKDDVMYHNECVIPPKEQRKSIMDRCHSMGHFGIDNTCRRILEEYWWPTLYHDVKLHIADCRACAEYSNDVGPKRIPRAPRVIVAQGVGDIVSMDYSGPFTETSRGKVMMLMFTDHTSKYKEAFATKDKSAVTTARHLFYDWICRFGPPIILLSDQGKEFCNQVMDEVRKLSSIVQKTTSGYHPETNGLSEKSNDIIESALRKFTDGDNGNWDLWLPFILLCDRTRIHKAIGHTPMFMMFGRECLLFKDYRNTSEGVDPDSPEHIQKRLFHIRHLIDVIEPSIVEDLNTKKAEADAALEHTPGIPIGTYVQLKRMTHNTKLSRRYQGLYQIEARTSEGNYKLQSIQGRPLPTPVHPNRIRVITSYIARELLSHPEFNPPDEDDENVFEVEEIRDHRSSVRRGRTTLEYLVKWLGFNEETWEPEENIFAPEKLDEYWKKVHKVDPTQLNAINNLHEDQLCEQIAEARRSIPSPELQGWIKTVVGIIDIDICPSQRPLSFCKESLYSILDSNDQRLITAKTIWFDSSFHLEDKLFTWLHSHVCRKVIYTLTPEWVNIPQDRFTSVFSIPLPAGIPWFTWPGGQQRAQPHWKCNLSSFIVV